MNIFNKKTILFFSISFLMINGCVAKNEFETKSPTRVMLSSKSVQTKPMWAKVKPLSTKKKITNNKDCIDCFATPIDYSKPPSVSNNAFAKNKVIDSKYFGDYGYTETASDTSVKTNNYANANRYVVTAPSSVNSSYISYSKNTNSAIQVGAFRQYAGAEVYMKRYNALSNKYKVTIKTGRKNNKPLYRVRIEGFINKAEAKKFMYSYAIRDAFIVRK